MNILLAFIVGCAVGGIWNFAFALPEGFPLLRNVFMGALGGTIAGWILTSFLLGDVNLANADDVVRILFAPLFGAAVSLGAANFIKSLRDSITQ